MCSNIKDVYCYSLELPKTSEDAFNGSYIEYATLHVPAASLDEYKQKAPWSNFGSIIALTDDDPKPSGINVISTINQKEGKYFDLNGRKVVPHHKGIYIHNGQKILK